MRPSQQQGVTWARSEEVREEIGVLLNMKEVLALEPLRHPHQIHIYALCILIKIVQLQVNNQHNPMQRVQPGKFSHWPLRV